MFNIFALSHFTGPNTTGQKPGGMGRSSVLINENGNFLKSVLKPAVRANGVALCLKRLNELLQSFRIDWVYGNRPISARVNNGPPPFIDFPGCPRDAIVTTARKIVSPVTTAFKISGANIFEPVR